MVLHGRMVWCYQNHERNGRNYDRVITSDILFRNSRHSGLDLYVMYLWHNKRKDDLSIILQLLVVCSILDVFIVRNDNITAEDGDDK